MKQSEQLRGRMGRNAQDREQLGDGTAEMSHSARERETAEAGSWSFELLNGIVPEFLGSQKMQSCCPGTISNAVVNLRVPSFQQNPCGLSSSVPCTEERAIDQ